MKPRTAMLLACSLVAICLSPGCGSNKPYADAEEVFDQYASLIEEYAAALDQADNAQAVAAAVNRFADGMQKLQPAMERISEKYPELETGENVPEELKHLESKMEEVGTKMGQAMMKVMSYMNDPEVQKALERLESTWED